MIASFTINPSLAASIDNNKALLEQVVSVANEYLVDYMNSLGTRDKPDVKLFDETLYRLLCMVLDRRLQQPLRGYVVVKIKRDKDNLAHIELTWDSKRVELQVPLKAAYPFFVPAH